VCESGPTGNKQPPFPQPQTHDRSCSAAAAELPLTRPLFAGTPLSCSGDAPRRLPRPPCNRKPETRPDPLHGAYCLHGANMSNLFDVGTCVTFSPCLNIVLVLFFLWTVYIDSVLPVVGAGSLRLLTMPQEKRGSVARLSRRLSRPTATKFPSNSNSRREM
jgi:hypothetical protein